MTLLGSISAAAGSWLVLACLGGASWSLLASRLKRTRRIPAPYPHNVPVWPTVTQADADATWLSVWPSSVDDVDEVDREFTSIISAEWLWPDTERGAA